MLPAENAPQTENNVVPLAQSELATPTRRDWLLFVANLFLLIAAIGLMVGFFVWRQDKPPNNPGGPLRDMGGWVLCWEWFALAPGPMLAAWNLGNALRFVGKIIKARYGEPPPLSEEATTTVSWRDKVIAAGCFAVVIGIAAYIVLYPPHGWREELVLAALILVSVPFSFGILPPLRKGVVRRLRWIAKQHGKR